jgi:signal transduction histidine kinase
MKSIQNNNIDALEINILNRIILVSIVMLLVYAFFDIFYLYNYTSIYFTIVFLFIYIGCLGLVMFGKNLSITKRLVMGIFIFSTISGFFSSDGYNNVTALDISNIFLIITVLFIGKERTIIFSINLLISLVLFIIQVSHPELISNLRANDTEWFEVIKIFLRIMMAANVGLAVRSLFEKENIWISNVNKELKDKNEEILTQNEKITQQREEIKSSHDRLEMQIQERTRKIALLNEKLLEFAFFNSHKIRGPLARILGLVNITNLLKIERADDLVTVKDYLGKIDASAKQLDEIVREINILLSEREKILNVNSDPKNR